MSTLKLKPSTVKFIGKLLTRELKAEYIQDNPNPLEVEYVNDLIEASKDFAQSTNDWVQQLSTSEDIALLLSKEK